MELIGQKRMFPEWSEGVSRILGDFFRSSESAPFLQQLDLYLSPDSYPSPVERSNILMRLASVLSGLFEVPCPLFFTWTSYKAHYSTQVKDFPDVLENVEDTAYGFYWPKEGDGLGAIVIDLIRPSPVQCPPLRRIWEINTLVHEFGHHVAALLERERTEEAVSEISRVLQRTWPESTSLLSLKGQLSLEIMHQIYQEKRDFLASPDYRDLPVALAYRSYVERFQDENFVNILASDFCYGLFIYQWEKHGFGAVEAMLQVCDDVKRLLPEDVHNELLSGVEAGDVLALYKRCHSLYAAKSLQGESSYSLVYILYRLTALSQWVTRHG